MRGTHVLPSRSARESSGEGLVALALSFLLVAGCDVPGRPTDASAADATVDAAGALDAVVPADAVVPVDAFMPVDAVAPVDAFMPVDAVAPIDAVVPVDAYMPVDATLPLDAASADAFVPPIDAGHDAFAASGGCVSGATGTRAVRFRWRGSGPGSTAYVDYQANELPDTTRWRVSSASMSFSYTPTFDDTFLGEGGLDLEGTAFIDVEISTAGLPVGTRATLAIYGRSFATTTSGSFTWRTFHGTGATPPNFVANSAPYQWYLADVGAALPAGDATTLLRIYPGPSSDALIVSRVEICFE